MIAAAMINNAVNRPKKNSLITNNGYVTIVLIAAPITDPVRIRLRRSPSDI